MGEIAIIQRMYDFIQWYVPLLNRLPRDHRYTLGERMIKELYELLETMIQAKYTRKKLGMLYGMNIKLEILRYQTRMLLDFQLIQPERYEHAGRQINAVGVELGGWIKQQKERGATTN